MPHATMAEDEVPVVKRFADALNDVLLSASRETRPSSFEKIPPPLSIPELDRKFGKTKDEMLELLGSQESTVIELAFKKVFLQILTSTNTIEPSFSTLWNLLDVINILSDREQCAPASAFVMVEEFFECQTIENCKRIFDYLESRRERMIAVNWDRKQQTILRECNELLKRLSTGEDTLFYGRVLIYMFRCFPLGHRSAINLRGEFHVDNVTIFDTKPTAPVQDGEAMEIDRIKSSGILEEASQETKAVVTSADKTGANEKGDTEKGTAAHASDLEKTMDLDELYSVFWSLQDYFSKPTQLFDPSNLKLFKRGLVATIAKFKEVQQEQDLRAGTRLSDEPKQGMKRKWDTANENVFGEINPKYLTSRDLFALEMSDLAFRRHILVQSLILIEFLLSLTPKAKSKISPESKNKAAMYSFEFLDDEAQWALSARSQIASYLAAGQEGKFYYRMVDTVLARDKNWVHWKYESCPPFSRPAVSGADFLSATSSAAGISRTKKLRTTPMNAFDISFLADEDGTMMLDKLRNPARGKAPTLEGFEKEIANVDMDLEFLEPIEDEKEREAREEGENHDRDPEKDKERAELEEKRRLSVWKSLRAASGSKLKEFAKIDDAKNIMALFRDPEPEKIIEGEAEEETEAKEGGNTPFVNGQVRKDDEQMEGVIVDGENATRGLEKVSRELPAGIEISIEDGALNGTAEAGAADKKMVDVEREDSSSGIPAI